MVSESPPVACRTGGYGSPRENADISTEPTGRLELPTGGLRNPRAVSASVRSSAGRAVNGALVKYSARSHAPKSAGVAVNAAVRKSATARRRTGYALLASAP